MEREEQNKQFKLTIWNAPSRENIIKEGIPFNQLRGTDFVLLCFNPCKYESLTMIRQYKQYFDSVLGDKQRLKLVAVVPAGFSELFKINQEGVELHAIKLDRQLIMVSLDEDADGSLMNPLDCISLMA